MIVQLARTDAQREAYAAALLDNEFASPDTARDQAALRYPYLTERIVHVAINTIPHLLKVQAEDDYDARGESGHGAGTLLMAKAGLKRTAWEYASINVGMLTNDGLRVLADLRENPLAMYVAPQQAVAAQADGDA